MLALPAGARGEYDAGKESAMIELTEAQRRELQQGSPVRVLPPEVGAECVILRADVYERLRSLLEDDMPDMRDVALLIAQNMREDDEHDPLLDSYQEHGDRQ
jgi:hypothetical protein